jgi:hypothetical protein
MSNTHGTDGLTLSAVPPGDRIELLTETDHWLIDIFSNTLWLDKQGSNEGRTRITPYGTRLDDVTSTDWLCEHGTFKFFNHRMNENQEIGPIVMLVWKKNYTLLDPPPEEAPTHA